MIEEKDKIFAAAVVDSGSSFFINGRSTEAFVRITRSHHGSLAEIHRVFGGNWNTTKDGKVYSLTFNDIKVGEFLLILLPYLKDKLPQAELILRFRASLEESKRMNPNRKKVSQDQLEIRKSFGEQLKKLRNGRT